MKKLVVLSGGLVAVGSIALVGAGIAMSQPGGSNSANVVGEPYGKPESFAFEPRVAEGVFEAWVAEHGIDVFREQRHLAKNFPDWKPQPA